MNVAGNEGGASGGAASDQGQQGQQQQEQGQQQPGTVDVNAFKVPEGHYEGPSNGQQQGDQGQQGQQQQEQGQQQQQNASTAFVITEDPMWLHLSSKLGEGFKMPDGVTAENSAELYLQTVLDNVVIDDPSTSDLHPMAREVQEFVTKNPEGDVIKFLNERTSEENAVNMGDEDFFKFFYTKKFGGLKSEQNPNGVTLEALEAQMNALKSQGTLSFHVMEKKQEWENGRQSRLAEQQNTFNASRDARIAEQRALLDKEIGSLLEKTVNYTDIHGVKVEPAKLKEFNTQFKELVTPDESGNIPAKQLLNNDEVLYQVLFLAHNAGANLKDALSHIKQSVKNNVENNLNVGPGSSAGTGGGTQNGQLDPNLWKRPEGGSSL